MREKTAAPKQNEERTRMPVVKLQRIMIKNCSYLLHKTSQPNNTKTIFD